MKTKKRIFDNILLLLVSCMVSLVLAELVLRCYLYTKDASRSLALVITTYQKIPYSKGIRYFFDSSDNLKFKASVRYNNWGYRSDFDWKDKKEPGEFRIAIFGDSYTECEPSDFSWVDVLHKKLSANTELLKRINYKTITVANFGRSGSGFQRFAQEYLAVRDRFNPDLTVFAFIDEDFKRVIMPIGRLRNRMNEPELARRVGFFKESIDISRYLQIPGFDGHLYAVPTKRNAFPRALYYAGSEDKLILDKESLGKAKRFLTTTIAREKYLKSNDCELFKLLKSVVNRRLRRFFIQAVDNDPETIFLKAFYESVDVVGPEQLILVNLPTFYETVNRHDGKKAPLLAPKYFPQAALEKNSLRFIPLADFLPKSASYEEKYSWFTLPWDGHPSNQGAEQFGSTLSKLLEDYLMYSVSGQGKLYMFLTRQRARELLQAVDLMKERRANEIKAYRSLKIARQKRGEKNYEESLESFSQVLQLAPYLGMPGLLYVERGDIYKALGRTEEALKDYSRAIAINPYKSFLIRHATIANALNKTDLVSEDIKKLEVYCDEDAKVKQLVEKLMSAVR